MKHTLTVVAGLAALALPGVAHAAKPTTQDRQNAASECRTERGTTDASREAFAQKYGTNKNRRNAFGKCVSRNASDEAREGEDARESASAACREERGTTDESREAFAQKYGTNKNRKNAFGKCVSGKAKQLEREQDAEDRQDALARRSVAKACDEERGTTTESRRAFAEKYGTGKKRRNAFGKCVSKLAQEREEAPATS